MLRRSAGGLIALVLVLSLFLPASAATTSQGTNPNTDAPIPGPALADYVIVELQELPLARYDGRIPGYPATRPDPGKRIDLRSPAARAYGRYLAERREAFKDWLRRNAPNAQVVREFEIVAHAVAVKLNGHAAEALARAPGVARVLPTALYRPTMNVSTGLINAPALWEKLGGASRAGEGIKVAIIDTGIDLTNPFLSDEGYPPVEQIDACRPFVKPGGRNTSNKVVVCRVYASGVAPGAAAPLRLMVFDHGTHVAGTVAGNFGTTAVLTFTAGGITTTVTITGLSGVAPRALLGDYNVFPGFGAGFVAFGGAAFSHDIAAALEDALRDGMDVANMSLGGAVQGPHDFLAEAVNAAVEAGMVVAVAAGNSGPGDMTIESPGSAEKALTAGASTNPHFVGVPVTVISDTGTLTFGAAVGEFNPYIPPISNAPFTTTVPTHGCTAIMNDVSGKIALIDRGLCTFTTKIRNAQNAGAIGVIVVNHVAGDPVAMGHDGTEPRPIIPAVMVSREDGAVLKSLAGKATLSVDGTRPQEFVTANADIIAGFSSRGPAPFTFLIKPDVTAPGVNVLSSVFNGEFAFFQGTSMSTPHVAGAAALLRQLHPDWSPDQIKSALVNTAKRPVWHHVRGMGTATGVLTRGGGRIDLAAAGETPLTVEPASVSFGFWNGNKPVADQRILKLTSVSESSLSCTLAITIARGHPALQVTISPNSIDLEPGAAAQVTLSMSGGRALPTGDYEGDLEITCGGKVLRVPWWLRVDREGKP